MGAADRPKTRFGVVGLGLMGSAIARRLLLAGNHVVVWNRSPAPLPEAVQLGAISAASPAAVLASTDVCITMVAGPDALAAVTSGPHGVLSADVDHGAVLVDMSTVSPADSAELARAAHHAGVSYLRAPVSGNPAVVSAGRLMIMVSGDRKVYDGVSMELAQVGSSVVYLGSGEEARVAKLALNLMLAGTMQLLAEALALCEGNGLQRSDILDVICKSVIGSRFVEYKSGALIEGDYSTTFTTAGMRKDLDLASETAVATGLTLEVTELVRKALDECIAAGWGDLDFSVLVKRRMSTSL